MGTSTSHASPRTTNWNAVIAGYRSDRVPVERVVQELWRAAQSDADANWGSMLGAQIVSTCLDIALQNDTAAEALSQASRAIALSGESSLATEVAQRAVVQSVDATDRSRRFAEALFMEASNYLVSRDLPGFTGVNMRNVTVADGAQFKSAIRTRVAEVVGGLGPAPTTDPEGWQRFVSEAVRRLAR